MVFGSPILSGGDIPTPNFGQAFSNRSHFRTCRRLWRVPFSKFGG